MGRAGSPAQATGTHLIRTNTSHGMTQHELQRLSGAVHCLRTMGLEIWTCAIGDAALRADGAMACYLSDQVKSRIVRLQGRAGLPLHWIEVIEVKPSRHSHLIFVGTDKIARAIYYAFPSLFVAGVGKRKAIQWVYDTEGLIGYLSHERTPQASVSLGLPRKNGTFRMEGGGDRVNLSTALKQASIDAGLVEPWHRTNTSRKPKDDLDRRAGNSGRRPAPRPNSTSFQSPAMAAEITEAKAMAPTGQIELFRIAQPVRLRDYHGGLMPSSIGQVIEFRRRQRGVTQKQLGRIAGISQPTLANAIAGRFPLSEWAANRLREALLEPIVDEVAA